MLAIESMSGVGRSGAKPRYSSVTFAKSDCNCREARNQTAIDAAERFSPIFVAGTRHVRGETLHTRLYHITHDEIVSPHNSSLHQRKL